MKNIISRSAKVRYYQDKVNNHVEVSGGCVAVANKNDSQIGDVRWYKMRYKLITQINQLKESKDSLYGDHATLSCNYSKNIKFNTDNCN